MIRDLEINGLRGLKSFSLHDLGRVNLLVGTNNCGKTTVLESLQMLSAPADLHTFFEILSRRGEDFVDDTDRPRSPRRHIDIRRLFFGHEIDLGSKFSVVGSGTDGGKNLQVVVVENSEMIESSQQQLFDDTSASDDTDELAEALAIRFSWSGPRHADLMVRLSRKGGLSSDSRRRIVYDEPSGRARLITTASLDPENVVDWFEAIVLTPEEEFVVEALKIIEPSIERIATGNSERTRLGSYPWSSRRGILVRCQGVRSRIPIGSMGDGIWRMLGLALALVQAKDGILLVDEIDTGLHYTVMENMWRLIYQTAVRLNVQVFATTHSRDCYQSLSAICRENNSEESEITIQRIERGKASSVGYSEQEIIAAATRGMEVR